MKINAIIITTLIIVAIFNVIMGNILFPLWAYFIIEFVDVLLLVFFTLTKISEYRSKTERKMNELNETIKNSSSEICTQISNQNKIFENHLTMIQEKIIQQIIDANKLLTDSIKDGENSINERISQFDTNVKAEFIKQSECIESLDKETALRFNVLQKQIDSIATNLSNKANLIDENITSTTKKIEKQIDDNNTQISSLLSDSIVTVSNSITANADAIQQASDEKNNMVLETTKVQHEELVKKVDGLALQGNSINDNIKAVSTDISAKTDLLVENIKTTGEKIEKQIDDNNTQISSLLSDSIVTVSNSITASADAIQQASDEKANMVLETTKVQHEELVKKVDGLALQGNSINDNIKAVSTDISAKTDTLVKNVKSTEDVLNKHIDDTKTQISKLVTNSIETVSIGIQKNYDVINKDVAIVKAKTQNIEDAVFSILDDDSKSKIIDSIKALISNLQADIKNRFSDFNNQLFDTQVSQEKNNNELEKLTVLFRTVLSSFSEKNGKIVDDNQITKTNSSTQLTKQSTSSAQTKINPNRTETITDSETKNVVNNQFKEGVLVKSTMKDVKGRIIYELEYSNGKIIKSKNYNEYGKITVEQTYYDNGQVHFRNEYTPNGNKKSTEFDLNGKKK